MDILTRKQAKLLGLKKYFTGKPCKNNHVSERYVDGGNCVECLKEKHVNADKELKRVKDLDYYHKNKTTINQKKREKYKSKKSFF
jgi:hypothetical protein